MKPAEDCSHLYRVTARRSRAIAGVELDFDEGVRKAAQSARHDPMRVAALVLTLDQNSVRPVVAIMITMGW